MCMMFCLYPVVVVLALLAVGLSRLPTNIGEFPNIRARGPKVDPKIVGP